MPGKARVHELAKELGITSKDVLAKLKEQGEFVKSASSTVEAPVARRLRDAYAPKGAKKPTPGPSARPAPPAAKPGAPAPKPASPAPAAGARGEGRPRGGPATAAGPGLEAGRRAGCPFRGSRPPARPASAARRARSAGAGPGRESRDARRTQAGDPGRAFGQHRFGRPAEAAGPQARRSQARSAHPAGRQQPVRRRFRRPAAPAGPAPRWRSGRRQPPAASRWHRWRR